jgi:PBSX family phage terminase large subunit
MTSRLSDHVPAVFHPVHNAGLGTKTTRLVLKGGRGGGKSSYAAVEAVYLLLRNPAINVLVLRKVARTLRRSVFAQYRWALDILGVRGYFRVLTSPMEMTYLPTGQKILFEGADDPDKLKSIHPDTGYIGIMHVEECNEMDGETELRNIRQSALRGGPFALEMLVYNPPVRVAHWVNAFTESHKGDAGTLVCHSSYLDVPVEWLGRPFIAEADALRERDPHGYEHEYLGKPNGTGGEIFRNLVAREIPDDEFMGYVGECHGLDFGYGGDPLAYLNVDYHNRRLVILSEVYGTAIDNADAVERIRRLNPRNEAITADTEPRSINEFNKLGLKVQAAHKGAGSRSQGIKWLADLREIVVDPNRTPNAFREFYAFELERDKKTGAFKGKYPETNDHTIDAVRYAVERHSQGGKWLY